MPKNFLLFIGCLLMFSTLGGCQIKERPIKRGEACAHCKMPVSDLKFAAEIVTKKGKIYVYDDITCAAKMIQSAQLDNNNIKDIFVSNFYNETELLNTKSAFFISSEKLRSPMNGNIAAVKNKPDLDKAAKEFNGEVITLDKIF